MSEEKGIATAAIISVDLIEERTSCDFFYGKRGRVDAENFCDAIKDDFPNRLWRVVSIDESPGALKAWAASELGKAERDG